MSKYAFLRNYRMDIFYIADFRVRRLLEAVRAAIGVSWEEFVCLTGKEIGAHLAEGSRSDLRGIEDRMAYFDVFLEDGQLRVATTPPEKDDQKSDARLGRRIEGQVANRGSATGRACLVMSKADNWKVKEGDIVVSPMTTPDMNLALRNAVAIVTDEGGILSHAAQYSREVGIPAIIGTEVGTEVIADGDTLAVDAEDAALGCVTIMQLGSGKYS